METKKTANKIKTRDWTDDPNMIGNSKTVKELVESGDKGEHIAVLGRVFQVLSDMRKSEMESGVPQFLYPTSRKYQFDETASKMVLALEEKDYRVSGINVKFDSYGPSNSYTIVREVKGSDFRMRFGRPQGSLGNGWSDVGAIHTINIPGKELTVYEDNSGPTFYLYVGKNWTADKEAFERIKVNALLNKEPKIYLEYSGAWGKRTDRIYPGKLAPLLRHKQDEREYSPEGDEPRYFETKKVFEEFKEFLQGKLELIRRS